MPKNERFKLITVPESDIERYANFSDLKRYPFIMLQGEEIQKKKISIAKTSKDGYRINSPSGTNHECDSVVSCYNKLKGFYGDYCANVFLKAYEDGEFTKGRCELCYSKTKSGFNINFKLRSICDDCANSITLQQTTYLVQQNNKQNGKSN